MKTQDMSHAKRTRNKIINSVMAVLLIGGSFISATAQQVPEQDSAPVAESQPMIPNQGVTKVIACGYDAEGIWRVLPLTVSYQYNGVQYNVNVLNAWNPWTDRWETGVDQQAYNTNYYLNGVTYSFYAPLSTGTYYFNL